MADLAASYPEYAKECGDPSRTKILGVGQKPAIILVDVCAAYLSASSPIAFEAETIEQVSKALVSLLLAARELDHSSPAAVPVFYTQTEFTHPTLRDAGLFAAKNPHAALFAKSHPLELTAIPHIEFPAMQRQPLDTLVTKKYMSGFFGTNLSTQLTALGVDTVLIAGFLTSTGVRSTAIDAMQSGFRAIVVADACADRGHETHWANLMDHNAKYGDVLSISEACRVIHAVQDHS